MEKEEVYRAVCLQLIVLFRNECGWKFFREEMFNDTASGRNAKAMQEYLQAVFAEHPWLETEFRKEFPNC